jgi:hypothetical protein
VFLVPRHYGGDSKYRGVGLEILALLLLGLIAMLAIVPPIIRGKLDESPLATTQSFQRSMQEMAHSIECNESQGETGNLRAARTNTTRNRDPYALPARAPRKKSAAVRRNRVTVVLSILASIWGVATLVNGSALCLAVFAIMCGLLVVYWALAIILPRLYAPPRAEPRFEESTRAPRRQAS